MRRPIEQAALLALAVTLAGCGASSQLGFDAATNTVALQTLLYNKLAGYKIICDQGAEFCMIRAEAICGGANYKIVDRPSESPPVQALVNGQMVTLHTSNPHILKIACS
jgi:hypothetical protein